MMHQYEHMHPTGLHFKCPDAVKCSEQSLCQVSTGCETVSSPNSFQLWYVLKMSMNHNTRVLNYIPGFSFEMFALDKVCF